MKRAALNPLYLRGWPRFGRPSPNDFGRNAVDCSWTESACLLVISDISCKRHSGLGVEIGGE